MRNRQYRKIRWPVGGVDLGRAFVDPKAQTCVYAVNVRNWDPRTGRMRGSQRAGLSRYLDAQPKDAATGSNVLKRIQDINQIVTHKTGVTPLPTKLQNSNWESLCVAEGEVKKFDRTSFTNVSGGTLSANAPVIFSASHFFRLYYADGASTLFYDGSTGSLSAWTPTAGSLPGSGSDRARLIENWRSRIVLAGLRSDPQNWFMSALGDPNDWDYAPSPATTTQAVAGNNAPAGKVAEVINSMCPYDDDTLLFFGDHTIWQMTGDPAEGGRLDLVSDLTGAPFGRPWCKGPQGEIYFFGQRGGIWIMAVGNKPQRISSGRLEDKLQQIDMDVTLVRAIYDDYEQAVHFYLTRLDDNDADPADQRKRGLQVVYDLRTESFWFDEFVNASFDPLSVHIQEGDGPNDRATLIGCRDGYIRYIDYSAKSDDTEPINSYVYLGPFALEEDRRVQLRELIATLDENADGVDYKVYAANSAQAAFDKAEAENSEDLLEATEFLSGRWGAGKNPPERQRASGNFLYLKLQNDHYDETWGIERLYGYFVGSGLSRMREL